MTAPTDVAATRPRGRRAWLVLGVVAAVAGLGLGVLWTVSALGHETRTVTRSYDAAKVRILDVEAGDGNVVVVGDAETTSVDVRLRITEDVFGSDHSIHLRDDGRLAIRTGCHAFWSFHCGFRIEVHVPQGTVVDVDTDNGDIRVEGIEASTELDTDNGDVRVEDMSGSLRLSTDNGDVVGVGMRSPTVTSETDNGDVTLLFERAPRRVRAASDNGDLDLRLPKGDDAYAVHTETDNGSVATPIRTDPTSVRSITATSDNGDIAIRYAG